MMMIISAVKQSPTRLRSRLGKLPRGRLPQEILSRVALMALIMGLAERRRLGSGCAMSDAKSHSIPKMGGGIFIQRIGKSSISVRRTPLGKMASVHPLSAEQYPTTMAGVTPP